MKRLAALLVFAWPLLAAWPNGYTYRATLVIDHTKVSGTSDLANFPVLVSLTNTDLKTVANGGKVQNASGYDIVFASDGNGSTPLYWEIENYDGTAGSIVFWVNVPTISHSVDTTVYAFYSKTGVATFQSTATSVWDANYQAVWHMKENGHPYMDSTSNGLGSSSATDPTQAAGQIGYGQAFPGSAASITINDSGNLLAQGAADFTVEMWANPANTTDHLAALNKGNTYWGYQVSFNAGTLSLQCYALPGVTTQIVASGMPYTANAWQHFAFVRSAGGDAIYQNGAPLTLSGDACTIDASPYSFTIGSYSGNAYYWDGMLDEIRMSSVARGAGWVGTEYANQNAPAAFFSSVTFGQTASAAKARGFVVIW